MQYNPQLTDAEIANILEDGVIDVDEVNDLRSSKVNLSSLMKLGEGMDDREDAPEFLELLKEAAKAAYLEDDITPGEIDDEEVEDFLSKIDGDGVREDWEVKLAEYLYNESENKPEALKAVFA